MQLLRVGPYWSAKRPRVLAVDTETTHTRPQWPDFALLTVQWCFDRDTAYTARADQVPICVWEWLENPNVLKVYHNAKFDWKALWVRVSRRGRCDATPFRDTRIIRHLIDPTRSVSETLKSQARMGGVDHWTSPLERWQEIHGESAWPPPDEILYPYGAMDALATFILYRHLLDSDQLDAQEWHLLDILMEEDRAIARMELNGLKTDVPRLQQIADDCTREADSLFEELITLTGLKNPNAPPQLARWLYKTQRIACPKRTTKGGESTDEDALLRIQKRKQCPAAVKLVLGKVLKMRGLYKQATRIVGGKKAKGKSFFENTAPDGILYANWNLTGTKMGRMNSTPNMQNLDREGPLRSCIITRYEDGEESEADPS